MKRTAIKAQLRAKVNKAELRIYQLHAMRDWLGIRQALADYWVAANAWRSA